jgi:iron complex transport system permease protein
VSSAATLGAVIAEFLPVFIKTAVGKIVTPSVIGAFLFSLLCAYFITQFSKLNRGDKSVSILLGGAALGALFSALTSIIILMHDRELHKIYIWNLGSFSGKGWSELVFILLPSVIAFFLVFKCSRKIDLISAGVQSAQAMGLNVQSFQKLVLCTGCLCASCAVCCGGTIAFIGLISPHIIRKCVGPKARPLFILSCITGSSLLLFSDVISRTAARPQEIPIGIITSLIGSPFFLWILFSKKGTD